MALGSSDPTTLRAQPALTGSSSNTHAAREKPAQWPSMRRGSRMTRSSAAWGSNGWKGLGGACGGGSAMMLSTGTCACMLC
eukprot:CAMPEP_0202887850 /NCGR_PEP_ID=MMETSP1391-20130828/42895_1 /ASSEMBLY_ACC=CAM_ASM_000867 /TAXON_ID=1034604 /ORGANISM="Chlamydomonas leiostraca, Strain SAG 11-49" /LENGTH=80 /DNA_ID=CAMNT_0049571149 /DNA_START=894 /DNA_END=1136 /DNA_ORIENTATION=-